MATANPRRKAPKKNRDAALTASEIAWNKADTRTNVAHAVHAEADARQRERMELAETNQDFLVGHFMLDTAITGGAVAKTLAALRLFERLYPRKPIVLELNSPGGVISEGFHLYDELLRLRKAGHRLTIRGRGEIASMASVVLQAGDVREIGPSTFVMIHTSSGGAGGKSSDIEVTAAYMRALEKRMCDVFAALSGKTVKTFQEALKKNVDVWMTAEETVKAGLADRIS